MSDTPQAAPGAADPVATPRMNIRSQFIKDMSFENIAAQKQTRATAAPDVKVGVNLDAKKLEEGGFEVSMKLEVRAEAAGEPLFLLELEYSGIFAIENVPDQQMHPYLMIECPRMLFPFARRIVSDVTRDGGFPPVNVDTIDFLQLYRNEILRRQAAQQQQAAAQPNGHA